MQDLYQEIILDHYKHPRGKGQLAKCTASAHHINPTCGDEVTVQVDTTDPAHLAIAYEGQGCSISQASASVMYEQLASQSIDTARATTDSFRELMHSKGQATPDEDVLGDGVAFVGVAQYPARVKCALLPWMALGDALNQATREVS